MAKAAKGKGEGKVGQTQLAPAGAEGLLATCGSSGAPVGTYAWMAPEAIRTGHFSKASDVWRFAPSIYEYIYL